RVLSYHPYNSEAGIKLGLAYFKLGKKEKAKEIWEEVKRKDPANEKVRFYMGLLGGENGV
ncbi:hypothetical protein DRQ16_04135, partial [bacterium]